MVRSMLNKIAYKYYPKGVCSISEKEKYINSKEYKLLFSKIDEFHKNETSINMYNLLISEFNKSSIIENIHDVSVLNWQDRCLSFELEIVVGKKLIKICLNISLLIPYYLVYVLENDIELKPYKWLTLPKRNKELEASKYKEHLQIISSIVEKITFFNKFPEDLINISLPDLSFQDIRIGNFTYYNAFFLNENKLD